MIFNEHVAPSEPVVHVTYHVTIDMSVNHVSFSLEKLLKSRPQPPLEHELVEGQTQSLARTSSAVPQLQKDCASGQREEFKTKYLLVDFSVSHFNEPTHSLKVRLWEVSQPLPHFQKKSAAALHAFWLFELKCA